MKNRDAQPAWWWVISLTVVGLVTAVDLFLDFATGMNVFHVVVESLVLIVLGAVSVTMWQRRGERIRRLDRKVLLLDNQVRSLGAAVNRWRAENEELMQGLGRAIDIQFERWKLSGAEAEVALLLLKGFSLREIGAIRETSERTSRDQARAVYRKSGLSGRTELSAFFLEDLLLPRNTSIVHDAA